MKKGYIDINLKPKPANSEASLSRKKEGWGETGFRVQMCLVRSAGGGVSRHKEVRYCMLRTYRSCGQWLPSDVLWSV